MTEVQEPGPWDDYGPWMDYSPSGFDSVIGPLLKREGGYVNDPDDRGGETKYGISKKAYPGLDIANLTEEDAREIYRKDYWDEIGADQLPVELRAAAFDAAVNQGPGFAKRALADNPSLETFLARRKDRYDELIENDPSQKKFQRGWMNRLEEFQPPWNLYGGT